MLVVKSDAQDPADLLGGVFVLRGEDCPVTLVDQLQDAEKVFLERDGYGEDGLRAEAALLVPTLVETEVRMELRQLCRVVRILDIDRLARQGREAGDRRERLRNADLFRHVADLLDRVKLLVFGVDGVNRETLSIEQLEDLAGERQEDVGNRLSGIELIGDR